MIGTSEITGLPLYLNETGILSEKIIENKANYETSETNAISQHFILNSLMIVQSFITTISMTLAFSYFSNSSYNKLSFSS